jgi:hypothetical protein
MGRHGCRNEKFDCFGSDAEFSKVGSGVGALVTVAAGEEDTAPPLNSNYSRSLLFYTEPMTHTGIRATYAASDTVNVIVGVNNGWNTTSTSYGSKTAELGIAYSPNKILTVTAQALKEGTLTVGYDPVKSFELRIEVRYDESDRATFVRTIKEDGNVSAFADSQNEFALQGVYKF